METIEYRRVGKERDEEILSLLEWWAEMTSKEKHMVTETPESLEKNVLASVFAFVDGKVIGASGIFYARTKKNEKLHHDGMPVVELGSNIIDSLYRRNGIGQTLINKRLDICKNERWFPVSISSNPAIHEIFRKLNATPMDNHVLFEKMRDPLCICEEVNDSCNFCPKKEKTGWVFL